MVLGIGTGRCLALFGSVLGGTGGTNGTNGTNSRIPVELFAVSPTFHFWVRGKTEPAAAETAV